MGLAKNRWEAAVIVTGGVLGVGGLSAAPTPTLELPKQVTIVGADALMCLGIARCYFNDFDDAALKSTFSKYAEAGGLGVLAGYGVTKLIEALAAEALNFVPLAGWLASGLITAGVSGLIGSLFWVSCDRAFRNDALISTELLKLTNELVNPLAGIPPSYVPPMP